MALQINKSFDNGVVASECYVRISHIGYLENMVEIGATYYYNTAARSEDISKAMLITCFATPEGQDPETRQDQYNYLKTLEEFSEASDV